MPNQTKKEERTVVDHFYRVIRPLTRLSKQNILNFGTVSPIPRFDESDVKDLCEETKNIVKNQGPLLKVEPPCYIIGDVHGDIHDLLRILSEIRNFTKAKIIFLGDYIDRGGFSFEIVITLFTLLCKFPSNIILLRGNHEFPNVYNCVSLQEEINQLYQNNSLFSLIHGVFAWLPLATLISDKYLCLHGGIGPDFTKVSDIENIPYPIYDYDDNKVIIDILWSDPCSTIKNYVESKRGRGSFFGATAISTFLKENNLKMLIRGHQCAAKGVENFKDMVYTVFSTSFYNDEENSGAYLYIDENLTIQEHILQPMKPIRRAIANYAQVSPRKGNANKCVICSSSVNAGPSSLASFLLSSPTSLSIGNASLTASHCVCKKRISLILVPQIVKPKMPDLETEIIPTVSAQ